MHRRLSTLGCLLAFTSVAVAGPSRSNPKANTEAIHKAAISQYYNDNVFEAYLATLPKHGEYYIVGGDMPLTRTQVREYLSDLKASRSRGARPKGNLPNSELLLGTYLGQPSYWKDSAARTLTYNVDAGSFPDKSEYAKVVGWIEGAGTDWMEKCAQCGIHFVHLSSQDEGRMMSNRPLFTVKYIETRDYIAQAFFPFSPIADRVLYVGPQLFENNGYNPRGVMRHELGHILGYRHEQIRGIAGCYLGEDGNWKSITSYDSRSVMHYLCGGGGNKDFMISPSDEKGHRCVYQLNLNHCPGMPQ
jgi:hypothetical protein